MSRAVLWSEGATEWTPAAVTEAEEAAARLSCRTSAGEPLARHLSMGVGGPTPLMIWPPNAVSCRRLISWLARRGLPWRVLGGGTNVLVPDAGIEEAVLNLTGLTDGARFAPPEIHLPAGTPTARALRQAARHGLAGLEWATGLPGTVGGAVAGNAGCWGGEMADVVTRIEVIDGGGRWRQIPAGDLRWSYRAVDLEEIAGEGFAIVGATLALRPGDREELEERSRELQREKRRRQPIGAPNAGCIFRNPDDGPSAGELVDRAGAKGLRVGGAEISTLHGNFIVAERDATAADVDALIERVRRRVHDRFGVELVEEIRRW